jgi:hypothetical protein
MKQFCRISSSLGHVSSSCQPPVRALAQETVAQKGGRRRDVCFSYLNYIAICSRRGGFERNGDVSPIIQRQSAISVVGEYDFHRSAPFSQEPRRGKLCGIATGTEELGTERTAVARR